MNRFIAFIVVLFSLVVAQTYKYPIQYSGGTVSHADGDGYRHVPRTYGQSAGNCLLTNGSSGDAFWGACPGSSVGLDSAHVRAIIHDTMGVERHFDTLTSRAIVHDSLSGYLPLTGGTLTGNLTVEGTVSGTSFVGEVDSATVSGLSDSAKALVRYARTTALHDTADSVRAYARAISGDSISGLPHGSGTTNAMAKWTSSGALGTGSWTDSASVSRTATTDTLLAQHAVMGDVPGSVGTQVRVGYQGKTSFGGHLVGLYIDSTGYVNLLSRDGKNLNLGTTASATAVTPSGIQTLGMKSTTDTITSLTAAGIVTNTAGGVIGTATAAGLGLVTGGPYLPIAGGTLTSALGGTDAGFTGSLSYGGGVFRDYTASSAYTSLYASGVTPSGINYLLAATKTGTDTYIGGTNGVYLAVNAIPIISASSTGTAFSGLISGSVWTQAGSVSLASATGNVVYLSGSGQTLPLPTSGVTPGTVFHILNAAAVTIAPAPGVTLYYGAGGTTVYPSTYAWGAGRPINVGCISSSVWAIFGNF